MSKSGHKRREIHDAEAAIIEEDAGVGEVPGEALPEAEGREHPTDGDSDTEEFTVVDAINRLYDLLEDQQEFVDSTVGPAVHQLSERVSLLEQHLNMLAVTLLVAPPEEHEPIAEQPTQAPRLGVTLPRITRRT